MMKQYFKFDSNGYYVCPVMADYNTKNPKPNDVTDVQPGNGLYKAKFDGIKWIETVDQATLIQDAIRVKLQEINTKCNDIIADGIDIETSIGTKHFSLFPEDQMNLTGLYLELKSALEGKPSKIDLSKGVPYHADGELCRFWAPEDFGNIVKNSTNFIIYNNTYCNHLRAYIKGSTDLYTIEHIFYGIDLPEDLAKSLADILGLS